MVDLAGGIGVLLPAALGTATGLTAWAALGCVALQGCAIAFHASRGEFAQLPANVVFLVLSAFICLGRWRWVPVRSGRRARPLAGSDAHSPTGQRR